MSGGFGSCGIRKIGRIPIGFHHLVKCKNGVSLDRCLENLGWRLRFQEASLIHLGWSKSDHHPLLLKLEGIRSQNQHMHSFGFEENNRLRIHAKYANYLKDTCEKENQKSARVISYVVLTCTSGKFTVPRPPSFLDHCLMIYTR
ncbi:hypothetical protein JHK86_010656 [Glycine max]|nr:hypothetical protein JHK86_010656 [Glycine max]